MEYNWNHLVKIGYLRKNMQISYLRAECAHFPKSLGRGSRKYFSAVIKTNISQTFMTSFTKSVNGQMDTAIHFYENTKISKAITLLHVCSLFLY